MMKGEWRRVSLQPRGNLTAGIDIGINNLMAVYVEDGSTRLINGRPLKAISFYWRERISKYQSMLNGYGLETSKRLRRMYAKWRRQVRYYIDTKVREAVEMALRCRGLHDEGRLSKGHYAEERRLR
jgi:putative transposase